LERLDGPVRVAGRRLARRDTADRQTSLPPATRQIERFIREDTMLVVHVHVRVKPDFIAAFQEASLEERAPQLQEPGIARFDVIQQTMTRPGFVLVESTARRRRPRGTRNPRPLLSSGATRLAAMRPSRAAA